MCNPHYYRYKKYGDPLAGSEPRLMIPAGTPCSVDGCESPCKGRGRCSRHYREWLMYESNDSEGRKERERSYARRWKWERKKRVFDHYGWSCACCGEDHVEFLVIDHKNDDGAEHRRSMNVGGDSIYRWLVANDFPDEFQVLCHNCNWGKRLGGCPHQLDS